MSASDFDVNAYFARIGYSGAQTASLDTLRALHALHPASIPFENFNPILRVPVKLDSESLQKKLIEEHRGGYCFEHNLLLKSVLEALGFQVTGLAARVIWNRSDDAITTRGHMLMLIDLEGERYIADVGFGGQTLTAPLRLELDTEQSTPHEPCRLIGMGNEFIVQAKIGGAWKSMYRFDLQPQYLADYEVTNWYLSNHPESHFVTGLRAARAIPGRRYGLLQNELAIHELGGETTRRTLATRSELREALEEFIGIRLPEHPDLDSTLTRIATSAQTRP